ncbi:CtsR family transcriptional regulator [Vagococcus jeotgali]|uniref:CtsR family transcriptional regulator n=1 Tax=Vagococcus jeotgali TaxID=3109030 RepID=UPI002DD9892C|nr:CtsR family transcriptional regulator [Vagococcus sp. B2T-5]
MSNKNMSDIIEQYLKELLEQEDVIEIRRSEIAEHFNCVPSQINYVINTRFTVPKGYKVESKRGGGGYIRIVKVNLFNHHHSFQNVSQVIGTKLSESEGIAILDGLYHSEFITKRERDLLNTVLKLNGVSRSVEEQILRASLMSDLLERLGYEE